MTCTLSVRVLDMRSGSGIALIFPLVLAVSFDSSECAIALCGCDGQETCPSFSPPPPEFSTEMQKHALAEKKMVSVSFSVDGKFCRCSRGALRIRVRRVAALTG
jgi:hypothetical protein